MADFTVGSAKQRRPGALPGSSDRRDRDTGFAGSRLEGLAELRRDRHQHFVVVATRQRRVEGSGRVPASRRTRF
jgi:hypothetical protein